MLFLVICNCSNSASIIVTVIIESFAIENLLVIIFAAAKCTSTASSTATTAKNNLLSLNNHTLFHSNISCRNIIMPTIILHRN